MRSLTGILNTRRNEVVNQKKENRSLDNKEIVLRANGLSKSFPGVKALDDVSFELYKGEILAIVGENGAGKSTLIKILSGVYQADEGEMEIGGEPTRLPNPRVAFSKGICVVHQELSYIPELTIAENIMLLDYPTKRKGIVDWKKINSDAVEAMKKIGLTIDPKTKIKNCTTAQKQQVEIAKAIFWNARIIILDEPTAALNISEIDNLLNYLKVLRSEGISIIYITHKLEEIFKCADRVTVMRDGKRIETKDINDVTYDEVVGYMVGRELTNMYPKTNTEIGDVCFEVRGLTNEKVHDVDLTLHKGEILGLYGLMGGGHEEVAKLLFGDKTALSAEFFVNGDKVEIKNPIDAMKYGLAYVPSERKVDGLIGSMTVEENLISVHYQKVNQRLIDRKYDKTASQKWVDELSIKTPSLNTVVNSLSGGNQQKVIIGKWMEVDPTIFVMVDPTRGIDVGSKSEIYRLMDELCLKGMSVIMVTSEMPELMAMADNVVVMCNGRVGGRLAREEFSEEKIVDMAIGGLINGQ